MVVLAVLTMFCFLIDCPNCDSCLDKIQMLKFNEDLTGQYFVFTLIKHRAIHRDQKGLKNDKSGKTQ